MRRLPHRHAQLFLQDLAGGRDPRRDGRAGPRSRQGLRQELTPLKRWLFLIALGVGGGILFRSAAMEGIYIATPSMEPALPVGTHYFVDKITLALVIVHWAYFARAARGPRGNRLKSGQDQRETEQGHYLETSTRLRALRISSSDSLLPGSRVSATLSSRTAS